MHKVFTLVFNLSLINENNISASFASITFTKYTHEGTFTEQIKIQNKLHRKRGVRQSHKHL